MRSRNFVLPAFLVLCMLVNMFAFPQARVSAALPLVDDFESGLFSGFDANGLAIGFNTFQDPNSTVAIAVTTSPPAPVPGSADPNTVLKMDLSVASYAGFTHTFENATQDTWITQDWSAYAGLSFWMYGNNSGTTVFVDVLDNRNPGSIKDDAERWSVDFLDNFSGWKEIQIPFSSLHRKEIGNGAPNDGLGLDEVTGWAVGTVTTPAPQTYYFDNAMLYGVAPERPLTVSFNAIEFSAVEGSAATVTAKLSKASTQTVTVHYATTYGQAVAGRDFTPVSGTLTFAPGEKQQSFTVSTFDDTKYTGAPGVVVELSAPTGGAVLGIPPIARVVILDNEVYDPTLLEDFETYPYLWQIDKKAALKTVEITAGSPLALPGQGAYEQVLQVGQTSGSGSFTLTRNFATQQDWSSYGGVTFWYYGQNTGKIQNVALTNNIAAAKPPSQWKLAWSDEFNGKAGAPPNETYWGREIGDGTANGIAGWGNDEREFYTGGTQNAAMDGQGNLRITVKRADGTLQCYYGPCEYTSARLLTNDRLEIAYGRVEARVKVPVGAGLWPAFWMLGTNIDQVGWPQSGEIDIMEHVARLPNQVFGTLHGPGYSGGQSYGKVVDLGKPVADSYHIYAVEWQPDQITWLLDGVPFFTATPGDAFLQGKEWVFNHPFYILLNVAIGGNFGGSIDPNITLPQDTLIDYVRVYQSPPEQVAFRAPFTDNFTGWKQITLPFSAFVSDTGLTVDTTAITSLRFTFSGNTKKPVMLDQLKLVCASERTVTTTADSGSGSLRSALGSLCAGGMITFAPELAGQTITLTSAPLTLSQNVTIDGSAAPGLALSGNDANRVIVVNKGVSAGVKYLTITKGYGWDLAGGILNNGTLLLDHVQVTANRMEMATGTGDFWKGGGGIYNGDGSTLTLVDSAVSGNTAMWSGGGVYAFFNSTTTVLRSTISGNVSNDVGGGIRSLGNFTITDSTISGNTATAWHGGAIFHTDAAMTITSSTVAGNIAPDWAASAIFVGSFNAATPSFQMTNSIVTGNHWYGCDHWTGSVNFSSGGGNLLQDDSCTSPGAADILNPAALIGPLADNGGPTQTHALLAGSPAIDAAADSACSAQDQRGVTRPQGPHCDIGAFELAAP